MGTDLITTRPATEHQLLEAARVARKRPVVFVRNDSLAVACIYGPVGMPANEARVLLRTASCDAELGDSWQDILKRLPVKGFVEAGEDSWDVLDVSAQKGA